VGICGIAGVTLPDGVSLDFSPARPPADMTIEMDPPRPLLDLHELMTQLSPPGTKGVSTAARQCLADLAVTKTVAAVEALRQHLLSS